MVATTGRRSPAIGQAVASRWQIERSTAPPACEAACAAPLKVCRVQRISNGQYGVSTRELSRPKI